MLRTRAFFRCFNIEGQDWSGMLRSPTWPSPLHPNDSTCTRKYRNIHILLVTLCLNDLKRLLLFTLRAQSVSGYSVYSVYTVARLHRLHRFHQRTSATSVTSVTSVPPSRTRFATSLGFYSNIMEELSQIISFMLSSRC